MDFQHARNREIERIKQPAKNEERYEHPDRGQPELHVYQDDHSGEWSVWLNTGISDNDGLCVGHGATRDDAVADAVNVLEWGGEILQGTPSPEALKRIKLGALPPCWPTKRYLRFFEGAWQEADDVTGPWSRVERQRDSGGHTTTS